MEFSQQSLIDIILFVSIMGIPLIFILLIVFTETINVQYSSRHKWRTVHPNHINASVTLKFGTHLFSNLETNIVDENVFKRHRYGILCINKGGSCERRSVYLDPQNIIEQCSSNEQLTISKIEYRPIDTMRKIFNCYEGPEEEPNIHGEIRITLGQTKGGLL